MMSQSHNKLLCLCVAVLSFSASAPAQEAATATESGAAKSTDWAETIKSEISALPDRFFEDAQATYFNSDNVAALLWAGLLSAGMNNSSADDRIAEHFAEHDSFNEFGDETLDILGSPLTQASIAFLYSMLTLDESDSVHHRCARTIQRALALNTVSFFTLKAARHNDTPNGKSWAWPSGHTSSSFVVASVLHEYYGLKVGIPAYIFAGAVGYRMMDTGDHWASDIAFGATLGWVVGHTVAKKHKSPAVAGFEVLPYFGNYDAPALGISLARRF